jgi:hypothetical protein
MARKRLGVLYATAAGKSRMEKMNVTHAAVTKRKSVPPAMAQDNRTDTSPPV